MRVHSSSIRRCVDAVWIASGARAAAVAPDPRPLPAVARAIRHRRRIVVLLSLIIVGESRLAEDHAGCGHGGSVPLVERLQARRARAQTAIVEPLQGRSVEAPGVDAGVGQPLAHGHAPLIQQAARRVRLLPAHLSRAPARLSPGDGGTAGGPEGRRHPGMAPARPHRGSRRRRAGRVRRSGPGHGACTPRRRCPAGAPPGGGRPGAPPRRAA